ncbi:MAG: gamma-glutamyltransferase, partial [Acidimicrobiia bacterium]|nr:gamma-glutamyltransferase [Acidimicrobiia bacterium]
THLFDHGMDAQEALDQPRALWLGGDSLALEPGLDADALAARGWDPLAIAEHWFGVGQVIRVHDDGWLEGGSDPRHDGVAVGLLDT